jgi:hypothetical protein
MSQQQYHLILRPIPDKLGRSPEQRLRALLKASLRGYGLRAVRIEPVVKEEKNDR